MLADTFAPPHLRPAEESRPVASAGVTGGSVAAPARESKPAPPNTESPTYLAGSWTPEALSRLVAALGAAERERAGLPPTDLAAAWAATVEAFLDPSSPERREIEAPLAELCRLSPPGLDAALRAVLGGVRR